MAKHKNVELILARLNRARLGQVLLEAAISSDSLIKAADTVKDHGIKLSKAEIKAIEELSPELDPHNIWWLIVEHLGEIAKKRYLDYLDDMER